jgi:PAS domain S-box-containing protein
MTSPVRPSAASIAPILFDALDALGEGVIVTEGNRIVFADAGSLRISGYTEEELFALPSVLDIVTPADRAMIAERLGKRLRGEPLDTRYESAIVHRDGHRVPLEIAVHLQDAAAGRLMVFVRDISLRVRLEEEHDRLTARTVAAYEDLFERAPVAYHELDLDGRITRVNDTELALFGYGRHEMLGHQVWEFSAEPAEVERVVRARLAGHARPPTERAFVRKGGTTFWGWVQVREMRDERGGLTGLRAATTDTTELRQAQVALRASEERRLAERRRLEAQLLQAQKMEAIGRFAGGVAHDFNNLLTVIAGYAEMLADDLPRGSQAADDMREILAATSRATTMTRQLLAFSRKQVLQLRVLDLNEAVRAGAPMLQRLIGEDVLLAVRPAAVPLFIEADETQLQQVLLNLATNARDAMPDGGALVLETTPAAALPGFATAAPASAGEDGWARLSVHDTGCGMDEATKALIFEPFFTTKPPDQGTGLGLATSYGIVQQLQGHIFVESEPGRGTTFSLYFPLARGPVEGGAPGEAAPRHERPRSAAHILVVEDEPAVRELVTAVLHRAGYRVTVAASPSDALALSDEALASVDLMLSDVVMPDLRGPELLKVLRHRRPDLRALFMTGYVDPAIESTATVGRFLLKPFPPSRLLERVAEALH